MLFRRRGPYIELWTRVTRAHVTPRGLHVEISDDS
jgi:hypothetical protein